MRAEPLSVWSSRSISSRREVASLASRRASTSRATRASLSCPSSRKISRRSRSSSSTRALLSRVPAARIESGGPARETRGIEQEARPLGLHDEPDQEVDLDLIASDRRERRESLERHGAEPLGPVDREGHARAVPETGPVV